MERRDDPGIAFIAIKETACVSSAEPFEGHVCLRLSVLQESVTLFLFAIVCEQGRHNGSTFASGMFEGDRFLSHPFIQCTGVFSSQMRPPKTWSPMMISPSVSRRGGKESPRASTRAGSARRQGVEFPSSSRSDPRLGARSLLRFRFVLGF